jgi:hypothetical protein
MRGHIWFGVAAADTPVPSAHLLEYDPATATMTDRGNVVDQLQRLGLLRPDEHQAKIHSKMVQGPDGCLYFASMDEEGERENGSRLPVWGGHFWRLRLATGRWEHLGATPEALIAVARGGRFIYALGYFGHVLYQYDTTTGHMRRMEIGSVDGHITRNFFTDYRGHVYVPRLHAESVASTRTITVSLVEFAPDLTEVGATPLDPDRYLDGTSATGSHGIIAFQAMADHSIFFTTHRGYLFRVAPPPSGAAAAAVTPMGWVHPDGPVYAPSLFTPDGTQTLYGLAHARGVYEWLTCSVERVPCRPQLLSVPGVETDILNAALLYGSATRDAQGGHYVVGIARIPGTHKNEPIILRVEPAR